MTGYFAIRGTVFCTNPVLLLTLGALGCGVWCASCLTCIFLALNRCAELSANRFLTTLFDGNRFVCIIYLTVNRTIRRGVIELLTPKRWSTQILQVLAPPTRISDT
ncbi:hypothetical protein TELCIR_07374 [Teladorsagia circumcincta]|uniref:Uncharacterized protein n=1 Tax=Teladorsagia circumcincta TaxID=45464 RepID=A0A2G9UM00_TELCI|nr:hypothetical protein TELCIR_07374 [Teladorsagia circumcincta]